MKLSMRDTDLTGDVKNRGYVDNWDVLTFNAKWNDRTWEYWDSPLVCPVVFSKKIMTGIDNLVKRAFKILNCVDVVRFDIRLDNKN